MIKEIIKDIPRDLNGLDNLIKRNENITHTEIPETFIKENEVRLKSKFLATSIFISSMTGTLPNFDNINFDKHEGFTIEIYQKNVELPFYYLLNEYSKLFLEQTFNKQKFVEEILSFKSLKSNWDGYGAIPLEIKCAGQAINLGNKLPDKLVSRISEVFPNPNGTVTIEWENHSGERLVAEVGNFTYSYYLKLNSIEPKFFNNMSISEENIHELAGNIRKLFI